MSAIEVDYSLEGEGPPLYMVHGIGSRKATWNALISHLKDAYGETEWREISAKWREKYGFEEVDPWAESE